MKSIVLVAVLIGAAALILTLRATFPSGHSCTADTQGVRYQWPSPVISPQALATLKALGPAAEAAIPTVDIGTPHYPSGTPPLGFKSWEAFIAWAQTQGANAKQGGAEIIFQPSGVKPPSYATFQAQVSSGGITELAKGLASNGC
jgi:hypothetical protein